MAELSIVMGCFGLYLGAKPRFRGRFADFQAYVGRNDRRRFFSNVFFAITMFTKAQETNRK
jgi:hypothetical protein